MRTMYVRGTKARLSFSGGPHAPVNMADSMEGVNVAGKHTHTHTHTHIHKRRKWHRFAALYCAIFRTTSFRKSSCLEVFRDFYRLFGSRNNLVLRVTNFLRRMLDENEASGKEQFLGDPDWLSEM